MKKALLVLVVFAIVFVMVACTLPQKHTHAVTGELIVVKEATCGDDGMAHMFCTECGEIVNTIAISKTNDHTEVIVPAEEATCTETGLTEGKYCSVCNRVLVEQQVIPETHTFGEWETIEAATKTEDGSAERYCPVCNKYETMVLPYTGSEGLEYTLNADKKSYSVTGIGTCTDTDLFIPRVYVGLPVTIIGDSAFFDCNSLTSVVIPDSVTSIGNTAFSCCYSLTSVGIPNSVTTIGGKAFYGCYSLTSIVIPDSVTSIYGGAFLYCESLTSIEIPDSVMSIADNAFECCTSLTSIEVDENNEYYCSIDGNLYNKDATILIQYAIGKTDTAFTVPDSVMSIGDWAFECCTSLTSIVITDSVTSIGYSAFAYCKSLISVEIGDSVTNIGDGAFEGCKSLTSIEIPDSVTSIGDYAFSYCYSLTSIEVDENNEYYCSIDGNLYNKDVTTLTQYAIGKTDTAFTIPDSVTSIGNCAFLDCTSLTNVVIPNSVTSIGYDAFYSCDSLTSVVIPDSVTSIGDSAFYYCRSLTTIVIPDSVTSIGAWAFENCDSLTSITFEGTVEQWNNIEKGEDWNDDVPATEVKCSDGVVSLQ